MQFGIRSLPTPTGASVFTRKIQAGRNMQADLKAYGDELKQRLSTYPAQIFGKPARFKTERQRRFVLASIREGSIVVPRRRTNALGRGWTVSGPVSQAGSFVVSVLNSVPYAAIVQGRRIFQPGTKDMQERGWKNWEATAIGLLRKYSDRMRARIRSA